MSSGVLAGLPGASSDAGSGPVVDDLLVGLIDDAAVFPPASAPLPRAVTEHVAHTSSWYADLIGPLLVRASDAGALAALVGEHRVRAAPVAQTPDAALDAARSLQAAGIDVAWVEVPADGDLRRVLRSLAPLHVPAFVELDEGDPRDALDVLAWAGTEARPRHAKLRVGGESADAFPPAKRVAEVLREAVDRDVAVKLTAGMHAAIAHVDAVTGFAHHGFLNALCAVRAALNGAETPEVTAVVACTDPAPLLSAARRMSEADAVVVRAFLHSFGCCGVDDPVADLLRHGLIRRVLQLP